jgi:dTDP-glucose pyrophosphorylase
MEVSKFFITEEILIREAIRQLDQTAKRLLVIVKENKLVGVITDGDIRRWILRNGDFTLPVSYIMNARPIFLKEEECYKAFEVMKTNNIEGIPIINEKHEVVDVLFWNEVDGHQENCNDTDQIPVVIMAGGKGSRLYPYTKIIPKPLIPIEDVPIVERIMNQFMNYGFHEFYLTISYKKEMIKAYFSEESLYNLWFLEEEEPMGTAGSLALAANSVKERFFVSNCDILVDINYTKLLEYHRRNKNKITIVTTVKSFEIPYGVVTLGDNGCITSLSEKPKYERLVSTGMYVLETEVLKYIPKNRFYDMTELINDCLENQEQVGAYPIMDSAWLDMGGFSEMKKMAERLKL